MDAREFVDKLMKEDRVTEFCGVSDSTLKYVIEEAESRGLYTPFTNEGDAVAYAAGRSVNGSKVAVLMQNSGLTNASSPISSLTTLYDIPVVYVVGWRGYGKDEPQHRILGRTTINLINSITGGMSEINVIGSDSTQFDQCGDFSQKFYLITPGSITQSNIPSKTSESQDCARHLVRSKLIGQILEEVKDRRDVLILSTTGYTSRELMKFGEDRPSNFYMLGSMGCLASFALGVIKSCPEKKVIILDGDGSYLMRPEGLAMLRSFDNLSYCYILFNNGTHLSTGGQKLPSLIDNGIYDLNKSDFTNFRTMTSESVMSYYFKLWLNGKIDYISMNVIVKSQADPDLPRPTSSPEEIYKRFKEYCNS